MPGEEPSATNAKTGDQLRPAPSASPAPPAPSPSTAEGGSDANGNAGATGAGASGSKGGQPTTDIDSRPSDGPCDFVVIWLYFPYVSRYGKPRNRRTWYGRSWTARRTVWWAS